MFLKYTIAEGAEAPFVQTVASQDSEGFRIDRYTGRLRTPRRVSVP